MPTDPEVHRFEYRGYAEDSLFAQAAKHDTEAPAPETAQAEVGAVAVKPLAEVMGEIAEREAAKAARWQELTDSNWPPGRIEEKLAAEFPDLKTSEQIESEDLRHEAAERRHAMNLHGPKKQRTRKLKSRSPRDAGPPPHIAEDVRRAQGLIE